MTKLDVPFYGNTEDDTHCFQAVFKMILKHFEPSQEYSWEELDKITAKKAGLWTWPMAGLIYLKNRGYEIKHIEIFDNDKFAEKGEEYLIEYFGKAVADEQIRHSDIKQEREYAKEFERLIQPEKRIPELADIVNLISAGYLVICNVNLSVLNNQGAYAGHFVLITGASDSELVLHDPGLPAQKDRKVSAADFERAWAYPDERSKNVTAVRGRIDA